VRHVPYRDAASCAEAIAAISATGSHDGVGVDFLDGTVFSRGSST